MRTFVLRSLHSGVNCQPSHPHTMPKRKQPATAANSSSSSTSTTSTSTTSNSNGGFFRGPARFMQLNGPHFFSGARERLVSRADSRVVIDSSELIIRVWDWQYTREGAGGEYGSRRGGA